MPTISRQELLEDKRAIERALALCYEERAIAKRSRRAGSARKHSLMRMSLKGINEELKRANIGIRALERALLPIQERLRELNERKILTFSQGD